MQSRSKTQRDTSITRRTLLGTIGSAMVAGKISAQAHAPFGTTLRVKGPAVWLDMDQKELDDAYTQSVYAPNMQQVIERAATTSDATRRRLGEPRRLSYGKTPIESLDVYVTSRPNAPVHIHVHGGAWQAGSAKISAFPAELFVKAGVHYVALDFINVLEAEGNLATMIAQVRSAIAWVYRNAQVFGGDHDRLYVSGHSSGAHLASVVLTTDWQQEFGLPANLIKGGLLCSGMYDLRPVRLSVRSNYVKFTDAVERDFSAQRHVDRIGCSVVVAYGTFETPEFQRQARDFFAALQAAGRPARLLVGEGYNHFEILETLANPYGFLGHAVLEQMNLL